MTINVLDVMRKYQLLFGLIFSFSNVCFPQETLRISSCYDDSPIEQAFIFDEYGERILGYSDEDGLVTWFTKNAVRPSRLMFYKLGALDTVLNIEPELKKLCLQPKSQQLQTFEVIGKEDKAQSFREYLKKTISSLKAVDTTHCFNFTWECLVPDSGWSMSIKGIVKIPIRSYSKIYSGAFAGNFCGMSIRIDSSFLYSELLEKQNINHIGAYFNNHDFLRRSRPS